MRIYFTILLTATFFIAGHTYASVTMTGTRVIYPAQLKEKTIHLTNPDKEPYIVQMQIGSNDINSNIDDISPFVITPQIFRIEPGSGQSVRIIYTGDNEPQDRESLYYLRFSQLPVIKKESYDSNQLIIALTHQVKIFYRPKGLPGVPSDTVNKLKFSFSGKNIRVVNDGEYHAVIRHASLLTKGKKIQLANSVIIAPKSEMKWNTSSSLTLSDDAVLHLIQVNDFGADVRSEIKL